MLNKNGINPPRVKLLYRSFGLLCLSLSLNGCITDPTSEEVACSEQTDCPNGYDCLEGRCAPNLCEGASALRCNAELNAIESVCGQEVSVVLLCEEDESCVGDSVRCIPLGQADMELIERPADMILQMQDMIVPMPDMIAPDQDMITPDRDMIVSDQDMVVPDQDMITPDQDMIAPDQDMIAPVDDMIAPVDDMMVDELDHFAVTVNHSSGDQATLSLDMGVFDVQIALGPSAGFSLSCNELMLRAQVLDVTSTSLSEGVVIQVPELPNQPRQLMSLEGSPEMTLFVTGRSADQRALHASCSDISYTHSSEITELDITLKPLAPLHYPNEPYSFSMGLRLDQVLRKQLGEGYGQVLEAFVLLVDQPRALDDLFIAVLCMDPQNSDCATYMGLDPNVRSLALSGFQEDADLMSALTAIGQAVVLMNGMEAHGRVTRSSTRPEVAFSDVLVEDFSINWERISLEGARDVVYSPPEDGHLSAQWSFFMAEDGALQLQMSELTVRYSDLLLRLAEEIGDVNYPGDARLPFSGCNEFESITFSPNLCSGALRPMLRDVIEDITGLVSLNSGDFTFDRVPVGEAVYPNRRFDFWSIQDLGVTVTSDQSSDPISLCFSACRMSRPEGCVSPCF